jgi:hypothetical protein
MDGEGGRACTCSHRAFCLHAHRRQQGNRATLQAPTRTQKASSVQRSLTLPCR